MPPDAPALNRLSPLNPLSPLDASDPLAVAFAVRRGADRLRTSGSEPDELRAFVEKLRALAKDEDARVRQSVAEAAPYLPEAVFQELVPALAQDRSPFVRDAAERAERKRSALRRSAAQENEHDARVADLYREVGAHGARARTLAHRIASHETEYFVRRMVHEAGGSYMAFDQAARKLREGLASEATDRALLRAELDRMEERFAFFKHVLATARSNVKAEAPVLREENLGALVLDEVELLATRFPERAAVLVVDTSGVDRSLVADIDAAYLREALANILKNAVEAYDAQSAAPVRIAVTVRALPRGTDAEIAIADEGCGMDPGSVERAFVPFGSTKPGGTGFGLFIARRVARAIHGGELSLASKPGEGTTVTMTLPLRQPAPKKRGGARRAATANAKRGRTKSAAGVRDGGGGR